MNKLRTVRGEAVLVFIYLGEVLTRFNSPKSAEISRKRSVPSNLTFGNSAKRSCPGKSYENSASNVIGDSAKERVKQFPDEFLTADAGVLLCSCCREELPTKGSSIAAHVKSRKHTKSKEKKSKASEELTATTTDHLRSYVQQYHPVGENPPESARLY
eukprot:scpid84814/ scgid15425/ 